MNFKHFTYTFIGVVFFSFAAFVGMFFLTVQRSREANRVALDVWNRTHPEMRLTREEFDALSNRRMLNLNKSD
jgi:hypothetical protein